MPGQSPLTLAPASPTSGQSAKSGLAFTRSDVIVFHVFRTNAAHGQCFRIIRVLHIVDVSDIDALTHLAFLRGFFEIVHGNAVPPFVGNPRGRPLPTNCMAIRHSQTRLLLHLTS